MKFGFAEHEIAKIKAENAALKKECAHTVSFARSLIKMLGAFQELHLKNLDILSGKLETAEKKNELYRNLVAEIEEIILDASCAAVTQRGPQLGSEAIQIGLSLYRNGQKFEAAKIDDLDKIVREVMGRMYEKYGVTEIR